MYVFVLYLLLLGNDGGFVDMEELDRYSDRSECIRAAVLLHNSNIIDDQHEAVVINPKLKQNSFHELQVTNTIRFSCITVFDEEFDFSGDK